MIDTFELGPTLGIKAPGFNLPDASNTPYRLEDLIGEDGLLLGFPGSIWEVACIRRIMWLQRQAGRFALIGVHTALIVPDQHYMLHGFLMTGPDVTMLPLLADPDHKVHMDYHMEMPGLVLIDRRHTICNKWMMPNDRIWPRVQELARAIQAVQ